MHECACITCVYSVTFFKTRLYVAQPLNFFSILPSALIDLCHSSVTGVIVEGLEHLIHSQ